MFACRLSKCSELTGDFRKLQPGDKREANKAASESTRNFTQDLKKGLKVVVFFCNQLTKVLRYSDKSFPKVAAKSKYCEL